MKYRNTISVICLLWIIFPGVSVTARMSFDNTDSLLRLRNDYLEVYEASRLGMADTGIFELSRVLRAAWDLIETDNVVIQQQLPLLRKQADSLQQSNVQKGKDLQLMAEKQIELESLLYLSGVAGVILVTLFLITLFIFLRKRRQKKANDVILSDQERLITGYRKRVNELQNDYDNSRTQAQTLVSENSRLQKEVSALTEEVQKARDAGWSSEPGKPSFPEQIRTLEKQLSLENTRKKMMEDDLNDILRKLREEG